MTAITLVLSMAMCVQIQTTLLAFVAQILRTLSSHAQHSRVDVAHNNVRPFGGPLEASPHHVHNTKCDIARAAGNIEDDSPLTPYVKGCASGRRYFHTV